MFYFQYSGRDRKSTCNGCAATTKTTVPFLLFLIVILEQTLQTHDLAIPLPQYEQGDQREFFRLILLSSSDLQPPKAEMDRIERLYHQTGGRHVGIVFLLQENAHIGNGTIAFMKLQAR
jgi:hypothetical protein